ncbi:Electron transport complex subunit RsxG [Polaribacter huanghezhanensis]|uniref:FMN-binding protein n=1 Tax=Polaribacter huanghezhanensis TaxID=1354726 RepID=UPI00264975B0|nr:FMN-binding protein [Polaribacter huanghezhanensis]WKD86539.1 Electron transport complex subunit RsxG [Polaribacter huanghezhanensis]
MKTRKVTFLIVFFITSQLFAYQLPKKIFKKVHKELVKTFENTDLQLISVTIPADINTLLGKKIGPSNLFTIVADKTIFGYAYVDKAPSKTDEFDYLILLDKELIVLKTKVLIYREDYGGEIGSSRWLKQFIGKSSKDQLKYKNNIMAISGATISALSMTKAVNRFLSDVGILHKNNIL